LRREVITEVSRRRRRDRQPRVTVFTSPTCGYCGALEQYLRRNGIRFKEVDVSRDKQAARYIVRRSGQRGVPVVDIGGKIVVGFNRPKIDKLLGIQ
jgi:glutaredoxin 3